MTTAEELLARLRADGWTKYRIAKTLGISWNTVHLWERGKHEATEGSLEKLEALIYESRKSITP